MAVSSPADPADEQSLAAGADGFEHLSAAIRDGADFRAVLAEVRQLLAADTSVMLMLDPSRTMLETVASVGLVRTPRTAMRIPVGRGFAGHVAATREPVVISEVSEQNVLNPDLRRHGVRSLLGVPVMSGQELLGVLHVGSLTPRVFTPRDVERLSEAARRVADIVRARMVGEQHIAALVLQRSLLPARPPVVADLELAVRYIPADGDLGGDWYDVFVLPDDRVGIVMGDVVGHGLQAAVIMGRLRSALRAYALDYGDPAEVLRRLDRKISYFERGAMATVLYGVAAAPYEQFAFSCAGHFPPVLAAPGRPTAPVAMPADVMLGINPGYVRSTTLIDLPPGGAMCLFTDGLIERRPAADSPDEDPFRAGLDELARAFSCDDDPETACAQIIAKTGGRAPADDDIAVLVARRSPLDAAPHTE